ncbi:MAG: hypothetical protein ACKVHE_32990 [Planctomycetales bacterium]
MRFVHEPGSVVHVFVKDATVGPARRLVGYYDTDHLEDLSRDVQQYSGRATGIFYNLNPVDSSCLDRAKNCLKPVWNASSADESDILHRRLMLIDIDPVREPDCSATNEEKDVAYWLGRIISRDLRKAGWPKPVVVDSGNGFHLLYRVDLPVDDEELICNCLKALADKYDCEEVKIDTGVFDAPRIAKLPGTKACKGDSTPLRPHRQSGFFRLPADFKAVPKSLLCQLASQAPPKPELPAVPNKAPIQVGDEAKQITNARAYLLKIPPAISGQNGRNQFLNAACRLVDDFALSAEQARPLLEEYNQRCVPPFDSRGVQDKLNSALQKVAERNGPSGRLLLGTSVKSSVKESAAETNFLGHVPDFGYADDATIMRSVTKPYWNGFSVWYWLLWDSLHSDFHVPDLMLRQWHWGANHDRNWKARIEAKTGLKPVAKANCTAETCILHGSGLKHGHYGVNVERYGLLENFCPAEMQQLGCQREFELFDESYREKREELQKAGTLFNVYWPALVLGSSRKVGWSWPQQRLVVGMVLELTRTRRKAGEDIAGEIVTGGLVPTSKDATHRTVCPLLDPAEEYVSFAGNGKRKGRGYQLVGLTGKGWIHRAGYLNAPEMNANEQLDALKSFLSNLESLSDDLGLIPAAIHQGDWKNLDEMIDCTCTGRGRDWLENCTMRIYAPADWRRRWRKFFSDKLGFQWIPASPDDSDISLESGKPRDPQQMTSANQVKRWLKDKKWTQQRLAEEIASVTGEKCSVGRVQRHLSGKSQTASFFEEVDQVNVMHPKATPEVTKQC